MPSFSPRLSAAPPLVARPFPLVQVLTFSCKRTQTPEKKLSECERATSGYPVHAHQDEAPDVSNTRDCSSAGYGALPVNLYHEIEQGTEFTQTWSADALLHRAQHRSRHRLKLRMLLAFIVDIALFAFVKQQVGTLPDGNTSTSSAFWMTFVSLIESRAFGRMH
ncbi:hypothetical protein C8R47DRAFT_1080104 [Mycena vitilis]|nr:hypothetical protein C8R47DRAFT_1080104 [Mycena vitilis]